ncbi:MAG: hypothetical protein JW745_05555 [Sedimentisphaerales bacterium]|nr:hypothetical protein [Sedimentisphaerales bacterium]MBN2842591.1 hypothetical protein [Sedimentisphaerales bacterium]
MSGPAKVASIDNLKEFRSRLIIARERINSALSESQADAQRLKIWLTQEQKDYWQGQLSKRQEQYQIARRELSNRKNQKNMMGNRQDYSDQEKSFKKAEFLLNEAQEKLRLIQRWSQVLDKEMYSFKSAIQPITTLAQEEMPRAAAVIDAMVISLEKYAEYDTEQIDMLVRGGELMAESERSDNDSEVGPDSNEVNREEQTDERE